MLLRCFSPTTLRVSMKSNCCPQKEKFKNDPVFLVWTQKIIVIISKASVRKGSPL